MNRRNRPTMGPIFFCMGAILLGLYFTFAAVQGDGSVITWGNASNGGDSSTVKEALASGVQQGYSTVSTLAAVKGDGSAIGVKQ